jgi:hypothetical protein
MTLKINDLSGRARDFAEALYVTNTPEELVIALAGSPQTLVMKEWKLSERLYFSAISAALNDLREEPT